ncbi:hypothetical protein LTR36_001175 [Oleoguttula mirabilis]|uniref:MYND-type domain-containing protein n=1 Tax=Oleoguttula mirabilis TaxID=1507867 RepID=A0AAV9J3I7_9PEZI|nr:hypothetical protein LTR36_001175 [Oleoguttula mirabilis]
MGAWGLGLFQSDYDYDIIDDLTSEVGLRQLEEEANKAAAKHDKHDKKPTKTDEDDYDDRGVHYSVFADHCSSAEAVEVVKKYMEAGPLAQLVAKYEAKLTGPGAAEAYHPPQYILVLIGACAMTLGCTLAPPFLALLKKLYATAGLMRDAKAQMHKALHGGPKDAFVNDGTAYDFGSLGLHDTMAAGGPPDEDTMYPESIYGKGGVKMMNVQSPGGFPPLPPDVMADLRKKMQESRAARATPQQEYGPDVCGGCGTKEGEGGKELMRCAKCKVRRYCGRECQKKHWKVHKGVCCAAAPGM